jgi:hypothetical protein
MNQIKKRRILLIMSDAKLVLFKVSAFILNLRQKLQYNL